MSPAPVTILTSGIGFGVYIPALLVERRLRMRRIDAEVEVFEGYYTNEHMRKYLAHKEACRADFALAQMAHRMGRDVQHCLDGDRMDQLLAGWAKEDRDHFIVWSGFWLPALDEYRRRRGSSPPKVHLCRIDAEVSASFRIYRDLGSGGTEIWLWSGQNRHLVHEIPVTDADPLPFADRENRLVVHGGGWGLGTYRDVLPRLATAGYALDIVIHHASERITYGPNDRCFLVDPDWRPWQKNDGGRHVFPPVLELAERGIINRLGNDDFHPFHSLIRRARAVVSKPGGGTLIDSLASATPLVILDAYGRAEQSNGELWAHLGFGIPYSEWQAQAFAAAALQDRHDALVARARGQIVYPDAYADRLTRGFVAA